VFVHECVFARACVCCVLWDAPIPLRPFPLKSPSFLCCALRRCNSTECQEEGDYDTVAALFQVSAFFFNEPQRDKEDTAAVMAALGLSAKSAARHAAWGARRHFLRQELAREPVWRKTECWDAILSQTCAIEGSGKSVSSVAFSAIHAILIQFVGLQCLSAEEVRVFVKRSCSRYGVPPAEESTLTGLFDALLEAEEERAMGNKIPPPPTLTTYEPFAAGQAAGDSTPQSVDHVSTPLAMIGAAARAVLVPPPPSSAPASATPIRKQDSLTQAAVVAPAATSLNAQMPVPPEHCAGTGAGQTAGSASAADAASVVSVDQKAMLSSESSDAGASETRPPLPLHEQSLPLPLPEAQRPGTVQKEAVSEIADVTAPPTPLLADSASSAAVPDSVELDGNTSTQGEASVVPSSAASTVAATFAFAANVSALVPASALPTPSAAVPHLWQSMTHKEAETGAKALVALRTFPPPPDAAVVALLQRANAGLLPKAPPKSQQATVLATSSAPVDGASAEGARSQSASTESLSTPAAPNLTAESRTQPQFNRAASVVLTVPSNLSPARNITTKSRGMTIVRKFGGSGVGLSVTSASFSATLPTPSEAAATGAALPPPGYAESVVLHAPPVARSGGVSSGLDAAPPEGSTWTTVDIGNRGLLDAVLDTLVHTHRR
jgi:hypothetical protein